MELTSIDGDISALTSDALEASCSRRPDHNPPILTFGSSECACFGVCSTLQRLAQGLARRQGGEQGRSAYDPAPSALDLHRHRVGMKAMLTLVAVIAVVLAAAALLISELYL